MPVRRSMEARLHVEYLEQRNLLAVFHLVAGVADGAAGSLREALSIANSNNENDVINLAAGTYELALNGPNEDSNQTGDLDLLESGRTVAIRGSAATTLIDANGVDRVFQIFPGVRLELFGVTVVGGQSPTDGGGVHVVGGDLSIRESTLTGNSANGDGGGIFANRSNSFRRSTTDIEDSIVTGNSAGDEGGGVFNDNSHLAIRRTMLSNNNAVANGGAIRNHGKLDLHNSTLSMNAAARGGAISNSTDDGVLIELSTIANNIATTLGGGIHNNFNSQNPGFVIDKTTITGNSANRGGGVDNDNATLSIVDSTLSGNIALSGGSQSGGGIWNSNATLVVSNSTISGNQGAVAGIDNAFASDVRLTNVTLSANTSPGGQPGIRNSSNDSIKLANSIIAGNVGLNTGGDLSGGFTSLGFNLIGNVGAATGLVDGALGDHVGTTVNPVNPMLSPLAYHGGRTRTHLPILGSPAIDAGNPGFSPPPEFDQRGFGFTRVVNGRIEIGAVEHGGAFADFDADGDVDGSDFLIWQRGVGTSPPESFPQGDANNNGVVGSDDLAVWRNSFGSSEQAQELTPVSNTQSASVRESITDTNLVSGLVDSLYHPITTDTVRPLTKLRIAPRDTTTSRWAREPLFVLDNRVHSVMSKVDGKSAAARSERKSPDFGSFDAVDGAFDGLGVVATNV